jgi:hypothetical protein
MKPLHVDLYTKCNVENLNKLGFLHLISNSNYIQFKQAMNKKIHQQIQCIIQLAYKRTLANITKCEFTIGKSYFTHILCMFYKWTFKHVCKEAKVDWIPTYPNLESKVV